MPHDFSYLMELEIAKMQGEVASNFGIQRWRSKVEMNYTELLLLLLLLLEGEGLRVAWLLGYLSSKQEDPSSLS